MKNTNKVLLTIVCLFAFLLTMQVNANAQCTAVGIDVDGNTVSQSISCDYPVYQRINGDAELSDETYKAAYEAWATNHPRDYAFISTLVTYHIEITKSSYEAMDQTKREAFQNDPEKYVIVPNPHPSSLK